ncbi:putative HAUS augmin-like complex subunit 5 [Lupinus albus]|uniref:Putative HAUS augmin-like complex subunit 5 n=1 Tax=Lupinus albus TaxID=3870 RepID=A0A6A4PTL6_LUPAL|nr:putative HAUS augmin-like complex subunit 5 [Lupinus albus]
MHTATSSSSSNASSATPEAILEWLHKEMGYRPLSQYHAAAGKSHLPSVESLRKICRGNMIPVWNFLITRAKSEKTVHNIRRNITVHGGDGGGGLVSAGGKEEEGRGKGKKKEKMMLAEEGSSAVELREVALQERDSAAKEVERLRNVVRRQRKDLRARMLEVSREEAERKRMLDERSNYRHKQVMLEAYDRQCDEGAKIFAEYHKRLCYYVNQARDAQRSDVDSSVETLNSFSGKSEKEAVYSTVKSNKSADDVILIETTREKNIRKTCESLVAYMVEKIRNSFPAYEGSGIHSNPQAETTKLGFDFDGQIPDEVRTVIVNCLRSPPQLLQAITAYTLRLRSLISREIEKIDVRVDAETLRYKYENNIVMDISSSDGSSPLLYGNGKIGVDVAPGGSQNQLLERQKAHVQQFLSTEDALNKAAEARDLCEKLMKRLHGGTDVSSRTIGIGSTSQNVGSLRQLELDVWAKEREVAGLKASLNTLMSEIQRLNKLCAERKEAEDSLKKKWKKIEEFDSRRSELETIYTALLKANMDAASFWSQQPLTAREYASTTIIPACAAVVETSNSAKDLIEKEVSTFYRSPDNSLYMLPSTPQALLEAMGVSGPPGQEAVANAEINAAILTARAGARDPSAIPSICRVSAALQYHAGLEGSDAGLASVLESLEFCLKLRGSEASVLEDLLKAINLVHIRRDLVQSGHALLNHAYCVQQEYERTTSYSLDLAAEQEKAVMDKWLPELKTSVLNAQQSLEDCKYVRGLLDEWWEQPASTVVDWVTVDGQNVAAWHNHVKQLLAFYDKELL